MNIIEHYTQGKVNNIINEDGLFISSKLIALIDGVTTKTDNLYNGFKSGKIAKDILIASLKKLNPQTSCIDTFHYLNNELKKYYEAYGNQEDHFAAQIIIYNDFYKEIWNFGDCNCMINNTFHNHDKLFDEITSSTRITYNEILLKKGVSVEQLLENDLGADYIKPLLKNQFLFSNDSNNKLGYPVLNGFNIDLSKIITYKINIGDEIILASDGYPVIENTLEKSELFLKKVLAEDPLCMNLYRSTKGLVPGNVSYDDRTYIRFIV